MKKDLILVTGILLCMVLSGCGIKSDSADADQPFPLQNMVVDSLKQGTVRENGAGGADERGTLAERGTAAEDEGAVRADGNATGATADKETAEKEASAADNNAVGTIAGVTAGNKADVTQPNEPKIVDTPSRDFEEVKEYLAQFPNTLQELSETECYVILHGSEHSGREYLNAFIENVQAENPGDLVFVQFTTEGASILTYLNYDGKNVYCVEDISRDGYAGGNGEKYFENYYDSIWVAANTDAEGNTSLSFCALWEEDVVLDLFTVLTEEPLWYGLPPWAKPPAP